MRILIMCSILFENGLHEPNIVFEKMRMYENHMNPGVEYVSARVSPEIRKI